MKKVLLTLAVVFGGFVLAGAQEVVNGPVLSSRQGCARLRHHRPGR